MRSRMIEMGWKVLDVLFPPRCAGCGTWGEKYCAKCLTHTRTIHPPICEICGEPLRSNASKLCGRCQVKSLALTSVRSWAYFEDPLQSAIHNLKYRQDIGLGIILAKPMLKVLSRQHWELDAVTPVPLDKKRKKDRGYNQSALLAKPLSRNSGIPYLPELLRRIRPTRSQVGLSSKERMINMEGAFLAATGLAAGKTILLIDDVITTGSTLNACAKALKTAGAERVYGLTLARSVLL